MTTYTADDFKRAEFARHPDGRIAARVKNARHPSSPWTDMNGHVTDEGMAFEDWIPVQVQAGSYTRTDEEDWKARAERAERERDELWPFRKRAEAAERALAEMTAHRDQCRDTAVKWQMEANSAVQPRALTPDELSDDAIRRARVAWLENAQGEGCPSAPTVRAMFAAARTAIPQILDQLDQAEHRIAAVDAELLYAELHGNPKVWTHNIRRALDGEA